ncbi:ferrichrome transport ATP-binding protein FhuC [Streptococcus pneumoniae]|nr:ferrichrome transport ATP-binding protein FhuC [Streptococcus pneumoniae]
MKLENIDKSIQKQDILQGISLEVSPQKLTAFMVQMVLENRLSSPS